ncbi:MAG TPA: helical backbone metal receptor [Steroidobacteraceae bacterium]|nr:helical backbone metal receptor [Steroidobacteraceae bacterium]
MKSAPSRFATLAALAALLHLLAPGASAKDAARSVRDDTGDTVAVSAAPCRIVSLAPGTTAMLYAAGAGRCLVGTIAHSTEPAEAAQVPVVGDAETLDFEQLLALRPTVVVVAVDVVQRVRIDRLRQLGLPVYQVHVTSLAGMPQSLRRLGELTGTRREAQRAADALDADLAKITTTFRGRAPVRVLYQIWDKPIYTIGGKHVISDALATCGAVNVFGELGTAAPAVTREAAVLADPDLILASAPPGAATEWLAEWRKFPSLKAVRGGHIVEYTDERIDRMGPSVVAATSHLCDVIDAARAPRHD